MKITEYKVITRVDIDTVNDDIKSGWVPHGSLVIKPETATSAAFFLQPMVMVKEGDR